MATMNLTALIAEFGQVYENNGQAQKDIKNELFPADDISEDFARVPWADSVYKSVYGTIGDVLQAFGIPFNSQGDTNFTPWVHELGEFKIDATVTPDDVRHSWLGFLADLPEADRTKWPFMMWYIRQRIIPGANRDFLNKVAYFGWKKTGFNGTPTVNGGTFVRELASENAVLPANAGMDGLRTQIAKMVDAGRVTPITVGAWSTDPATFCTQIETFVEQIPDELSDEMDLLYMSKTFRKRYRDGKRAKYNMYYAQEQDLDTIADHENIRVKGTRSMQGSEQVWGTPAQNRVRPVRAEKKTLFDLQKDKRSVNILADWSYSLTVDVPEYVVTSEHDTTIDAGIIASIY